MRPRLLDLFCKAGGCTKGYQRAGFYVVGVDIDAQPRYCGDEFIRGDALTILALCGHEFDAIHASPPCQAFTIAKKMQGRQHPDLLTPTRELLRTKPVPWVIENVPGAPMNAAVLCATMFRGLEWQGHQLFRHRLFETGGGFQLPVLMPATCNHASIPISVFGHSGELRIGERRMEAGSMRRKAMRVNRAAASAAMGIDWMTRLELSQAIPPAYTEWIGARLREHLDSRR